MFCTKCGEENPESATFCIQCGSKLSAFSNTETPATSQAATARDTVSAYQKLGGGLAAIAYGRLLGVVLELAGCIAAVFIATCFDYYRNGNRVFIGFMNFARAMHNVNITGYGVLCYGSLVIVFLYAALLCCSIVMYRRIKARRVDCIRFYMAFAGVISCAVLAALAGGYLLLKRTAYIDSVMQAIPIIAGAAGWLLLDTITTSLLFNRYFKNSERTKIYFESKQ